MSSFYYVKITFVFTLAILFGLLAVRTVLVVLYFVVTHGFHHFQHLTQAQDNHCSALVLVHISICIISFISLHCSQPKLKLFIMLQLLLLCMHLPSSASVCVCACIYTCLFYVYMFVCASIHVYVVCVHLYMFMLCVYVWIYTCLGCVYIYVCTSIHVYPLYICMQERKRGRLYVCGCACERKKVTVQVCASFLCTKEFLVQKQSELNRTFALILLCLSVAGWKHVIPGKWLTTQS